MCMNNITCPASLPLLKCLSAFRCIVDPPERLNITASGLDIMVLFVNFLHMCSKDWKHRKQAENQ